MQLVIKNGKVIATHDDSQQYLSKIYPECEIIEYHDGSYLFDSTQGLADDPRSDAEKQQAYRDKRRSAYPSIPDQLDMQYWDIINQTTVWLDAIREVKTKYPKS